MRGHLWLLIREGERKRKDQTMESNSLAVQFSVRLEGDKSNRRGDKRGEGGDVTVRNEYLRSKRRRRRRGRKGTSDLTFLRKVERRGSATGSDRWKR